MANNSSDQIVSAALSELLQAAGPALQANLASRTAALTTSLSPVTVLPASSIAGSNASASNTTALTSGGGSGANGLQEEMLRLTGAMTLLRQVNEANQDVLNANTQALQQAATNQSSGSSNATNVAKTVGSFLLGGLGIGSLVSGIASLFGGGSQEAPPPLVKYAAPAALQYQGAIGSGGEINSFDYNDRNGIRPIRGTGSGQASSSAQQVIVQVNAIDSKSFLDHSDAIAQAVRSAMLNSSSLNDVIAEM